MVSRKAMSVVPSRLAGSPRICLVTRDEPGVTGTSRYVAYLDSGLRRRGYDVVRIRTKPTGRPELLIGAVGRRLGWDALTFLASYPARIRWPKADLYHLTAHTFASAIWLDPPPGPWVVTVYDIGIFLDTASPDGGISNRARRIAERLALRALKRCRSIVTISEWTKQTLLDELGIPSANVSVTPLGVEHDRYRRLRVPDRFRERYGLPDGPRYLLYVGSDEARKNLPNVWRAFRLVRDRFPDAMLLKVGRAYGEHSRSVLSALADELNLTDAIRYFEDIPEADLPLFYNLADVFVMPSLWEGFGLPALEAMACGTPVVVSHRAALPEVVGNDAGLMVDPSDPAELAQAISAILSDRQMAARLASRGRERAAHFRWDLTIDSITAAYGRLAVDAVNGSRDS